ncbi:MAG: restriction endonuclease subunit S [Saprospiraceae bacterium]|nr:restriction endonuclease subunit S [Saprospiraceae bacterium]
MNIAPQNSWSSKRLKYLATINDESLPESTAPDSEISYIDIGNVDSNGIIDMPTVYRFADAPSRARRVVKNGDVIISTVRTYLQAIAPVESPPNNLIVSTGFAVIRPNPEHLNPNFCKYALRESSFLAEVEKRSVGVSYPAINASELGEILIKITSTELQHRIASFLDQETAHIDALIAAKERMLALLAEKRQALITRAVTRGLDEGLEMKDSGVTWLGEVPGHWEVVQLKFVSNLIQTGPFGSQLHAEDYVSNGIPIINPVHLKNGKIKANYEVTIDETTSVRLSNYLLLTDDIVFARRGELGRCGIVESSMEGWLCGTGSILVRLKKAKMNPQYLTFLFDGTGASELLKLKSVGSTMDNLNTEILGNFYVPTPEIMEQQQIVTYIENQTVQLNALRTSTEHTISLLRERRSALIAAAVTGQVLITE